MYKNLRVELDAIKQVLILIHQEKQTVHTLDAIRDCRIAKALTGKMLGLQGVESPYKNDGKRSEISDIEKEAGIVADPVKVLGLEDFIGERITLIDSLREIIKEKQEELVKYKSNGNIHSYESNIVSTDLYNRLNSLRFTLGFELGLIKSNG